MKQQPIRYPGAKTLQGPPKFPKREEIWWWDHYTIRGWQALETIEEKINHPPLLCCSMGYVVAESQSQVFISQTVSFYTDGDLQSTHETQAILKNCILDRWEIDP